MGDRVFKNNIKIVLSLGILACVGMQYVAAKAKTSIVPQKTRQLATGCLKLRVYGQKYLKIVQAYNKQQLIDLKNVIKDLQAAKQECKYADMSKIFSAYEEKTKLQEVTYCGTKEVLREKMEKDGASQELLRDLAALELNLGRDGDNKTALDAVLTDTPDLPEKCIAQLMTQATADLDAYNQLFQKYNVLA